MPFSRAGPPPGRRPRRLSRDEIKADILLGLATGLPLAVIARNNGVSQPTVEYWKSKDEAFAESVAAARSLGWDHLACEVLEIIDDKSNDVITDNEGVPHFNAAGVLRAKAQCEMRLRLLACWDVGRYGPAKTLRVEGELQQTVRHVIDPASLDPASREALRTLLAHAEAQGLIPGPEPVDADFEELGAEEDVADG
jgi:hypothetical protein